MEDQPQSIFEHLSELRRRIIYSLVSLVICVGVSVAFAPDLFDMILAGAQNDGNIQFIQTTVGETFLTQFRLAIMMGLVLSLPFILYQLVAFILPALMPTERRILYVGLPFATLLFGAGWAFGWFIVVPITRTFFMGVAMQSEIANMFTPRAYLDFVLGICNPLGIAFQLPLLVIILARIGLVSAGYLSRVRRYAYFVLMVLAAVLSPPDVISMGIFMVPLVGLYEISLILARLVERRVKAQQN